MQIAPGIHANAWQALRLDDPVSPDWTKAITIFERRIRERYLDPVDALIDAEKGVPPIRRRFGFTVLAIDCLLVETLGAFLEGLEDTEGKSKTTFCKFLTTRQRFSVDFTGNIAIDFYRLFRCGILHQAETGEHSLIWSIGPLIHQAGGNLIVNRNEFHDRLKEEFRDYLTELADPNQTLLRANFRQKMNFIARIIATN